MQTKQMVSHLAVVARVPHILTYHHIILRRILLMPKLGTQIWVHWCFVWMVCLTEEETIEALPEEMKVIPCHMTCQMTKRFAEICTWNPGIGDEHRLTVTKMKPGVVLQVTTWRHSCWNTNSSTFFSKSTLPCTILGRRRKTTSWWVPLFPRRSMARLQAPIGRWEWR